MAETDRGDSEEFPEENGKACCGIARSPCQLRQRARMILQFHFPSDFQEGEWNVFPERFPEIPCESPEQCFKEEFQDFRSVQSDFFYTFHFTLEEIPADSTFFHASFRRVHSLESGKDFVIADGIKGAGRFAGCFLLWQQNNSGWWGEGEMKMFLDGDREYPSICGTGTDDYFCGAWGLQKSFTSPYSGYRFCGELRKVGTRHAMYRFHLAEPIWFQESFRCSIQALGWRSEHRYLPLRDDISAVAYWYQKEPHVPLPALPDRNGLEMI